MIECDGCLATTHQRSWGAVGGVDGRQYALFECGNCGLVTVQPPPTKGYLESYYSDGYVGKVKTGIVSFPSRRANESAIRDATVRLEEIEKIAGPVGRSVLDVGCGHGFFLAAARARGHVCKGVDLDEEALEYATAVLGVDTVREPLTSFSAPDGEYDLVTFWQVLEHLAEPGTCMRRAVAALKDGGVVAGSMPNIRGIGAKIRGNRWDLLVPPEHIAYFDEASCTAMLQTAGLQPLFVGTIPMYAAPYFKVGIRVGVMQAAMRASGVLRAALLSLHSLLTWLKRYMLFWPANHLIMLTGLSGNSVFFVARK